MGKVLRIGARDGESGGSQGEHFPESTVRALLPDGKSSAIIVELAPPLLTPNSVLCRATHSLVSAGTERLQIRAAENLSPDDIIQQNRRLGYCGAGIVEDVSGEEMPFRPGDRVAYYGAPYVNHSEYVAVPRHLVFRVPDSVDSAAAAFIGLGAIALHGFRKANLSLGDVCFVAGAGLVGNLCAQIAVAAGCRVVLSDINEQRLNLFRTCAGRRGESVATSPSEAESAIARLSKPHGADGALLCVSASSAEPIEQAIRMVRRGGRIVIIGMLDLKLPRDPLFQTEAEIVVSRAAGPGRYDRTYEMESIDYPIQYVRWTEGRNLGEVLRLLALGQIVVDPLIRHRRPVADAPAIYSEIMQGKIDGAVVIEW